MNVPNGAWPRRTMRRPTCAPPTDTRCLILLRGALLAPGRRTMTTRWRTVRQQAPGQGLPDSRAEVELRKYLQKFVMQRFSHPCCRRRLSLRATPRRDAACFSLGGHHRFALSCQDLLCASSHRMIFAHSFPPPWWRRTRVGHGKPCVHSSLSLPGLVDRQMLAGMLTGGTTMVAHRCAATHGEDCRDLERRVVPGPGTLLDPGIADGDGCGIDDVPVLHPTDRSGQIDLWCPCVGEGAVGQGRHELFEWFVEPLIECCVRDPGAPHIPDRRARCLPDRRRPLRMPGVCSVGFGG